MFKMIFVFLLIFMAALALTEGWRHTNQKMVLTQSLIYAIVIASVTFGLISLIVFLF